MKNNKGFTLVELAVTFTLVAAIAIILFQLVSNLRQIYLAGEIKTTLLNKQGIMVKKISDDLHNNTLTSIGPCGLTCLTFTYSEKATTLVVDPGNNTITYDNYTYKLEKGSKFNNLSFTKDETGQSFATNDDSVFKIDVGISSNLITGEDFGIHITGTYNRTKTSVSNQITYAANTNLIRVNGIDTNMEIIKDTENTNLIAGVFVKLYHLDANNYISNYDEFIYNTDSHKMSALGGLEAFKKKNNSGNILNDMETIVNNSGESTSVKTATNRRNAQSYRNGYYSLLLNYNNQALSSNKYYWWDQTNNFANKETIEGFNNSSKVDGIITGKNNLTSGLTYNNTETSFANIDSTQYNIGLKSGNLVYPSGNATSVDLYAEARNYICKYSLNTLIYDSKDIKEYNYADGTDFCN